MKTKIEALREHLMENGKALAEHIELESDSGALHQRDIIIICDTEAESSDDQFILESSSVSAAYEFLERNKLTVASREEYKGFTIKIDKDCWGGNSFFVYDTKGKQMFDQADTVGEAQEQIDNYLGV